MRRAWVFIAVIGALVILPQIARATITNVYSTRAAGTGINTGFDVVRWFVKFTPSSPEDSSGGLLTLGVTMQADKAFKFTTDTGGVTSTAKLDFTGVTLQNRGHLEDHSITAFNNNDNIASFIAIRPYDQIADENADLGNGIDNQGNFSQAFAAMQPSTSPGNLQPSGTKGKYMYGGQVNGSSTVAPTTPITEFRVEGFNQNAAQSASLPDPSAKSTDPNGNRGALFAVAVVPTGTTVRVLAAGFDSTHQKLALYDAAGRETNFGTTVFENAVPEPATFSIVGVGLLGLLARRSRKAA